MSPHPGPGTCLPGQYAFVDLETTGCNPERDRIIEVAVIAVDYGFLRDAFAREGIGFRAPVLCTLRLARSLYPRLRRHGLDHLVTRFGLACDGRHRALGDTRATLAFVHAAAADLGADTVAAAVERQRGAPALPAGLPPDALAGLPAAPGVYLFHGDDDALLYVGKSTDLRRRVMERFSGDHRGRRAAELAQRTRRVAWIETAGELGALLREADLVKRLRPLHNRRLRGDGGYLEPQIVAGHAPGAWPGERWFGPFGDRRAARRHLRRLADAHALCPRRLGLERASGTRPCFARQLQRCHGACTGEEAAVRFNLRLVEALAPRRIRAWPREGPVAIPERDPLTGRAELHVVDHWRYLGSTPKPSELGDIAHAGADAPFDRDHYRLLARWLARHPGAARPLAQAGAPGTA